MRFRNTNVKGPVLLERHQCVDENDQLTEVEATHERASRRERNGARWRVAVGGDTQGRSLAGTFAQKSECQHRPQNQISCIPLSNTTYQYHSKTIKKRSNTGMIPVKMLHTGRARRSDPCFRFLYPLFLHLRAPIGRAAQGPKREPRTRGGVSPMAKLIDPSTSPEVWGTVLPAPVYTFGIRD